MRIVSLAPFLTEIIYRLGLGDSLIGCSHRCDYPEEVKGVLQVTQAAAGTGTTSLAIASPLERALSLDRVDLKALRALAPEVVITRDLSAVSGIKPLALRDLVHQELGEQCSIYTYDPKTFLEIVHTFESVGKDLDRKVEGAELASMAQAQVLDWISNFYDRTRGKKVTFLSGTEPLLLSGLWIPDMIGMTSAVSQHRYPGEKHLKIEWKQILEFAPDVIIIAPGGLSLNSSMKRLSYFEKLPDWDSIPAVKRGEVIFCDGLHNFNRPGPRIVDSMGILISAIAGLESGYITKRDCFQRLRYVELHRQKL